MARKKKAKKIEMPLKFQGVKIPPNLLNFEDVGVFKSGHEYVIAKHDQEIGRFGSLKYANSWWTNFQRSCGQRPTRLIVFVEFKGVLVLEKFSRIKQAFVFNDGRKFVIKSKGWERITEFADLETANSWWISFQESRGDRPEPLIPISSTNFPPKTGLSPEKGQQTPSMGANSDPKRVWSDRWDMPEMDFE